MSGSLQCDVCGMKFRNYAAEAKHRHNFPAFCNRLSPGWKAYQARILDTQERFPFGGQTEPIHPPAPTPTQNPQALGRVLREPPVPAATFREACDRIFDIMLGDDGEAWFQAERFLKAHAPDLYERLGK